MMTEINLESEIWPGTASYSLKKRSLNAFDTAIKNPFQFLGPIVYPINSYTSTFKLGACSLKLFSYSTSG